MGNLKLDEYLAPGQYRELTEDELQQLRGGKENEI
jgi:16S rRNA U516 pseudouridylate synthase RsuA-like enzyme